MTERKGAPATKMWGGRFAGGLDPFFERFQSSLAVDRRMLAEDLAGSAAWARALGDAGALAAGEVRSIVAALEDLGRELAADSAPLATSWMLTRIGFPSRRAMTRPSGEYSASIGPGVGDTTHSPVTRSQRPPAWNRRRPSGCSANGNPARVHVTAFGVRTLRLPSRRSSASSR